MSGKCAQCGGDLYPGNVRVIRSAGKRTRREHRRCPEPAVVAEVVAAPVVQDVRYLSTATRYFLSRAMVERLERHVEKALPIPASIEVLAVPSYQVETDPDAFSDMVEVFLAGETF
jgi:hypothetical protein